MSAAVQCKVLKDKMSSAKHATSVEDSSISLKTRQQQERKNVCLQACAAKTWINNVHCLSLGRCK